MKRFAPIIALSFFLVTPAFADLSSVRPMPRPALLAPVETLIAVAEPAPSIGRSIRPEPRPETLEASAKARPKGFLGKLFGSKKAVAQKPGANAVKTYSSGSICNDSGILGTAIPAIRGAQKGCGVENPVRITEVDGVALSTPATIDCETARALRTWVTTKVKPAFGRNEVTGLKVAAHYACRGRNNKKGARISEHGRGRAIDIAGFQLADGSEVSVLQHYKSNKGKAMRRAHKGACGIFGTTLGPGSDGYHQDHIHLDTAKYRGGPYCK